MPLGPGLPRNSGPSQCPGVPGTLRSRQRLEPPVSKGAACLAAALPAQLCLPRVPASEPSSSTGWSSAARPSGEKSSFPLFLSRAAWVSGLEGGRAEPRARQCCGELSPGTGLPISARQRSWCLGVGLSVSSFLCSSSRWGRKKREASCGPALRGKTDEEEKRERHHVELQGRGDEEVFV